MQPSYIRTPDELARVVTIDETTENIVFDFKRTINDWNVARGVPNRDDLKAAAQKETCRDISQFANTFGGCLLIGVAEHRDPVTRLKIAHAIHAVTDPDSMRQWIEQAIRNYLVPATFSRDIAIVDDPRGTVLAVNVPPRRHGSMCPAYRKPYSRWRSFVATSLSGAFSLLTARSFPFIANWRHSTH